MSPEVIRWIIALAILGHGIGHVLFMPVLAASMKLDASGHSWLLTGVVGQGATQAVASVVAGALMLAFAAAAGGVALQASWWRGLVLAAAAVSIVLVVTMWDGLPTGPASAALAFDAVMLVALLVVHWPAGDIVGP
jgi:hypothetical protein